MKFKDFINSSGIQTINDVLGMVSFVKKSDNYTGTFRFNSANINTLTDNMTKLGYKHTFVRGEGIHEYQKKGLPVVMVVTDESRTTGTLTIERQNIAR